MSWKIILVTSTTALLTDFILGLTKKSPPYLLAPYLRLWKECSLLHNILSNQHFSQWKPHAARYVALRAIKAHGANQKSPQPALDLLESCLKRSEPAVLVGEPGSGKTTALEALTYRLAKRALIYDRLIWVALLIVTVVLAFAAPIFTFLWLASFILWEPLASRLTIPLFIEARSAYSGGDVNDWCEKSFKERLGAKSPIGSRRRIALFIDGLNEVQETLYGAFVEGWRARLLDKHACRVMFTSRGGEENPSKRLGVVNVLSVCDLNDDGVREFVKVYGREKAAHEGKSYDSEHVTRDFHQLQKKNLLGEGSIGRNPYWLKMIIESGLYTVNRGELFRSFAEKLIRREIEEKPEERKHKPDWKMVPVEVEMNALADLALAMHEEKRIGFSDEAGWDKARATVRKSIADLPYTVDDVLSEAQASTLLRLKLRKRVEFVHQLVQEFFAAYALHPELRWQDALDHCEDPWWWQTLFHLGGLVSAEDSIESYCELARLVLGDGSNERCVFAAIGLLRSVENTPSDLSSEIIEAFGGLMEANLTLRDGKTTLNLPEPQEHALHDLRRTLGDEAAETFALLLEHPRIQIQIIGILILSIIGTKRAAELIIANLNESNFNFIGTMPLVSIGEPAVQPIIALLSDPARKIPKIASALVEIGAPAVDDLIVAMRGDNREMRLRAAWALGEIGAPAVESLIGALQDADADVRGMAVGALGRMRDLRAVEPLIGALKDKDRSIREMAIEALYQIRDPRAIEGLMEALRDKDRVNREKAVEALYQIRDPRTVDALIGALKDNTIRERAMEALGELRDPRAIEPLVAALEDVDTDICETAALALGQIGHPRAIKPLITLLRDINSSVRSAAVDSLVKIGSPAFEPLIDQLEDYVDWVRGSAADALGDLGDPRAVGPLVTTLRMKSEGFHGLAGAAVEIALKKIGGPKAVELLIAALKDEDGTVRSRVADLLGELGSEQAVEPLIVALGDKDLFVRQRVVMSLGEIGDDRALRELERIALESDESEESLGNYAKAAAEKIRKRKERGADERNPSEPI